MTYTENGVEYIKIGDARKQLKVSQPRMKRLIERGVFTVYESENDARVKLIPRSQVDAYATRRNEIRPKSNNAA